MHAQTQNWEKCAGSVLDFAIPGKARVYYRKSGSFVDTATACKEE